ncbi:phycobilisome degradation protein NblB [Myxacorys almedinensis]|uniref:HEAT repeat domain-containing protein n=1 Tax=Myxacorys almedinensis A TaxID=2690445 RepID=A0A8J8CGG0_9CYAN|nr:HEAT repeat domain-containing protein [Myxacorys almedinensis]NDJ15708.1 HEAT repeat domain-containing protein [Myxacorys almedinensis A]
MTTPDAVKELLESNNFGDRLRGVNHLRQLDPAIAYELIKPSVIDENVRVRYAAISQLASLGGQNLSESLTMLKSALHDPEPDVQAAAADSIGGLHLTEAYEDLKQLYQKTTEWLVRFSIVAALGELGEARGYDLLAEALTSDSDLVVTAAIGSLGELGDDRAVPLLVSYASHPDWQIRYRVAQALGHFQTPEAKAALEHLAHDDTEQVAELAKSAL